MFWKIFVILKKNEYKNLGTQACKIVINGRCDKLKVI
jgi:hypothetical protein